MKKKLMVLLLAFSMLAAYIPVSYAEGLEYWIISEFTKSSALTVTEKKCVDGNVTLKGTDLSAGDKFVTATAYSEAEELIAISQAAVAADGSFEINMGLKEGSENGMIYLCGQGTEKINATVKLVNQNKIIDELEAMGAELDALADKCKNAGIPIDYAMVKVRVVDKFTEFLREDLKNGNDSRLENHYSILQNMYSEAKTELTSYLSGSAIPEEIPRYVTTNNADETDGTVLISDAEYNGETVRRPTYYTGYVGWDRAFEDMSDFDDLGMNFVHIEMSPNNVLLHPDVAKDWEYSSSGFLKPGSDAALVSGAGRNGGSAVKIVNTTVPDEIAGATHPYGLVGIKQTLAVSPNTTYKLSFYVKGTGINSSSYYSVGRSGRQRFASSYDDYTKIDYSYKTEADETSISINIMTEGVNTELYIDDVSLVKAWTKVNLVSNPDFEGGEADNSELRDGFKINYAALDELKTAFKDAEDNNIAVAMLFALHNFPAFITAEDSTIDNNGLIYTKFMPVNPTHPRVKEVLSLFATIIAETVGDSPALQSIVLANEPAFVAGHGGGGKPNYYYLDKFRTFLQERYGTISALNEKYSSSYSSFDEIEMPAWGNMITTTKTKLAVDYRDFNDNIVTEMHSYLAEAVRKVAPNVKMDTKMMAYLHENTNSGSNERNVNGNDFEDIAAFLDYNGFDGGATKGSNAEVSLQAALSWLDFTRSVKDVPAFNIEDHAMGGEYTADQADWIYGYLWQCAVHGKAGSALWLWDHSNSILSGELKDTVFTTRPLETVSAGKAALDLEKFADKLALFEKKQARVALFYSDTTSYWNNNYLNALYRSYCDIMYTGQKVDYITENAPEKLNSGNYDVLVVPMALNVPDTVLNAIIEFKNAGGKVILTEYNDNSALAKDKYNDSHSSSLVNQARNGCTVVKYSSVGAWYNGDYRVYDENGTISKKTSEMIRNYVQDANVLQIKDANTGELITNAEYSIAFEENGNALVNIYSFESTAEKNVNIYYNGEKVTSAKELISDKVLGENVTLKPYTPMLLDLTQSEEREVRINISTVNDDEITHFNSVGAGDVVTKFEIPAEKIGNGKTAVCVTAVYEGDVLVKCVPQTVTFSGADISTETVLTLDSVTDKTNVKAFVWTDSFVPITSAKKVTSSAQN